MSAKGGVDMDKFLKSFYDEHFASREINNIANTAEYKKRSEKQEQILKQIHIALRKILPANESIGLLNDYNDAMFHLLALYQYEDFRYHFLSGIQLGLVLEQMKQTNTTVEEIMSLLQHLKEDNS